MNGKASSECHHKHLATVVSDLHTDQQEIAMKNNHKANYYMALTCSTTTVRSKQIPESLRPVLILQRDFITLLMVQGYSQGRTSEANLFL